MTAKDDGVWILQKNINNSLNDHTKIEEKVKPTNVSVTSSATANYNNYEWVNYSINYECSSNNSGHLKMLPINNDILQSNKPQSAPPAKSRLIMFCEAISIRGMQKIVKAPNMFVKSVWISFVFLMTILLVVTSYFLISDFFNYNTAWHTSTAFDEKTAFPAISICSHNPFSLGAKDIWNDNVTLNPKGYRKLLTKTAINMLQLSGGSEILFDTAEDYYANIDYETTVKLSHSEKILRYCVVKSDMYSYISENCDLSNWLAYRIRRFSDTKYFNCFTIEENPDIDAARLESTRELLSIIILVELTPESHIPQLIDSFAMDTLFRGTGVKLVLHEVGSYPEIDRYGINLQPGKMNEIHFETVHWQRYNSPKRQCLNNQSNIVDLERTYKYTQSKCVEAELQKRAIKQCKCMKPIWPRPHKPIDELPYCNNFSCSLDEMINRIKCSVFKNTEKAKEQLVDQICFGVCSYYTYETKVSVTNWKPSLSKLQRITANYRWVDKNDGQSLDVLRKQLLNGTVDNLSDLNMSILSDEARFSYINVVRKNYDTIKKTERLVIDVSIFMSRVGGLCSLFVGLTTAVFAELIEFFYMAFYRN